MGSYLDPLQSRVIMNDEIPPRCACVRKTCRDHSKKSIFDTLYHAEVAVHVRRESCVHARSTATTTTTTTNMTVPRSHCWTNRNMPSIVNLERGNLHDSNCRVNGMRTYHDFHHDRIQAIHSLCRCGAVQTVPIDAPQHVFLSGRSPMVVINRFAIGTTWEGIKSPDSFSFSISMCSSIAKECTAFANGFNHVLIVSRGSLKSRQFDMAIYGVFRFDDHTICLFFPDRFHFSVAQMSKRHTHTHPRARCGVMLPSNP
jgi:hypothetical protein